ncbi:MAG: hypothetical protein MH204_00035 [Fimbriimonadaceae bacterium]|nr:hypothetical protein [Fimbriimonadaceae bacterium]
MKRVIGMAALAALAGGALAQSSVFETPTNLGLRLGYAYPLDSNTRNVVDNFFNVGVDFFLTTPLLAGGESYISIDWFGKSIGGGKGNAFPLLINHRFFLDEAGSGYFFGGLGLASVDITQSRNVLALRGGYGITLSEKLNAEAFLLYTDEANGARASALGVQFGFRF